MRQAGFQNANNLVTKVMAELGELETRLMYTLDERDQEIYTQPPTNDENQHPNEQALVMTTFPPGMMELL